MRQAELVPREHVARTLDGLLRGPEFTRERTLWDEIRDWLAAHFDLDDVLCADGQFDIKLDADFNVVEKRAE